MFVWAFMAALMNIRIDQGHYLHAKAQFLTVRSGSRGAVASRLQLKVLNAGKRKTVFKIGQEFAEIVKISHPTHVENGSLIRKFCENPDVGHDFAAELRNFDSAFRPEATHRLDDPGVHVARSHAFLD